MKLEEANSKVKNKFVKFDVPGFPVRVMQAPEDGQWLKMKFKDGKDTFLLRRRDVASAADFSDLLRPAGEKLKGDSDRGARIAPDGRTCSAAVSELLRRFDECAKSVLAASTVNEPVRDFDRLCPMDTFMKEQYVPDTAESKSDGTCMFYTFHEYDPVSNSKIWHRALPPLGWLARRIGGKTLEEGENASLDAPESPIPELD